MNVQAVLFDMDGVLVNSTRAWWKAYNKVAESQKLAAVPYKEFKTRLAGEPLSHDLQRFTRLTLPKLARMYERFLLENIQDVRRFPKTLCVLKELKARGVKLAVVTNSPKATTYDILKHAAILDFFDAIITGEDVAAGKPHPDIINKACSKLGVKPEDTITVGDTQNDVKAGKTAGCTVVGIGVEADYTIKDIGGLTALLQQ